MIMISNDKGNDNEDWVLNEVMISLDFILMFMLWLYRNMCAGNKSIWGNILVSLSNISDRIKLYDLLLEVHFRNEIVKK